MKQLTSNRVLINDFCLVMFPLNERVYFSKLSFKFYIRHITVFGLKKNQFSVCLSKKVLKSYFIKVCLISYCWSPDLLKTLVYDEMM